MNALVFTVRRGLAFYHYFEHYIKLNNKDHLHNRRQV